MPELAAAVGVGLIRRSREIGLPFAKKLDELGQFATRTDFCLRTRSDGALEERISSVLE
jgi:hypothetical protein